MVAWVDAAVRTASQHEAQSPSLAVDRALAGGPRRERRARLAGMVEGGLGRRCGETDETSAAEPPPGSSCPPRWLDGGRRTADGVVAASAASQPSQSSPSSQSLQSLQSLLRQPSAGLGPCSAVWRPVHAAFLPALLALLALPRPACPAAAAVNADFSHILLLLLLLRFFLLPASPRLTRSAPPPSPLPPPASSPPSPLSVWTPPTLSALLPSQNASVTLCSLQPAAHSASQPKRHTSCRSPYPSATLDTRKQSLLLF